MKIALLVALTSTLAAACGKKSPLFSGCEAQTGGSLALAITARDATSDMLIADATVTAEPPNGNLQSASIGSDVSAYPVNFDGPTGTYSVNIQAVGYAPWNQQVVVTADCKIITVTVTALMHKIA